MVKKTFLHTLCVVSTSDETTHCGIILLLTKTCIGHRGGGVGGEFGPKIAFFKTIFS